MIDDAENTLECEARQGKFTQRSGFYFLPDQTAREKGRSQIGHDGFFDGFRIIVNAADMIGNGVVVHDAGEQFPCTTAGFPQKYGDMVQIVALMDIFPAPWILGRGNGNQLIGQERK